MDARKRDRILRAAVADRYWDRKTAEAVLAEAAASGLTLVAFAERHGIHVERLRRWRRVLGQGEAAASMRFHPVVVSDSGAATVPANGNSILGAEGGARGALEVILCNGRRVAVHEGFDPRLLLDLIRLLEGAPC